MAQRVWRASGGSAAHRDDQPLQPLLLCLHVPGHVRARKLEPLFHVISLPLRRDDLLLE